MTTLKMKVDGNWIPVGGVPETVHTGSSAPVDPNIDLWVDTDEAASNIGSWPLITLQPFTTVGWTWTNQGAATVTENAKSVFLTMPASGGENRRSLTKALPAGTPTITMGVIGLHPTLSSNGVGIVLRESATGKMVNYMTIAFASGGRSMTGWRATTDTAPGTNYGNTDVSLPGLCFFRVTITATQYAIGYSYDGLNFLTVVTENKNAFFTTGPDRIGLTGWNSTAITLHASFIHWSET